MAEGKTTFLESTLSGIAGSVKGALTGGITGALLGAAIGASIAIFTAGFGLPAIAGGALVGAELLGAAMGAIGALSGTITGVVTSREKYNPTPADITNVAKMAYSQGVSTGRQLEQEQHQGAGQEGTKWRDRHAEEQAQRALSSGDRTIH